MKNIKSEKIKLIIKKAKNYKYKKELLKYLNNSVYDFDEDLLYEILLIIINKSNINFRSFLLISKNLYDIMVYNKSDISIFLKALSYMENDINWYNDYKYIYVLFENKRFSLVIFKYLLEVKNDKVLKSIFSYINDMRKYYIDEGAFFSSVINVINKVLEEDDYDFIINEQIKKEKEFLDIYDEEKENLIKNAKKIEEKEFDRNHKLHQIDGLLCDLKYLKEQKQKQNEIKPLISKIERLEEIKNDKEYSENTLNNKRKDIKPKSKENTKINIKKKIDLVLKKIKDNIKDNEYDITYSVELDLEFEETLYQIFFKEKVVDDDILYHSSIYKFLELYYFALYNDTLSIFHKIISKKNISYLPFWYFDKNLAKQFNEEEYVYLILNYANKLYVFYKDNEIDTFKKMLKINPKFLDLNIDGANLMIATKNFKVEKIANAKENGLINIFENVKPKDYSLSKKIFDFNPNFDFKLLNEKLTYIFSVKEIAFLNKEQIEKTLKIIKEYLKEHKNDKMSENDKKIIKKFSLETNSKAIYDYVLHDVFEHNAFKVRVEEYLLLNEEDSKKVINHIKNHSLFMPFALTGIAQIIMHEHKTKRLINKNKKDFN